MSPISEENFEEAKARLRRIESQYGIRILYAGELGSRARGVASSDADFDVRFLFVRPVSDYLKLTPMEPIIRVRDGEWDIRGMDLREALLHLKNGDPKIVSWLYANPVYRNHPIFETEMRKRLEMLAPVSKLWWHYFQTASQLSESLECDSAPTYKTLMLAAEAALSLSFLHSQHQLPPADFPSLLISVRINDDLRDQLQALANEKKTHEEADKADSQEYSLIIEYLHECLKLPAPESANSAPLNINEDDLNEFFLRWVGLEK